MPNTTLQEEQAGGDCPVQQMEHVPSPGCHRLGAVSGVTHHASDSPRLHWLRAASCNGARWVDVMQAGKGESGRDKASYRVIMLLLLHFVKCIIMGDAV